MKKLKKILALTLCIALILALGCQKKDNDLKDVVKQEEKEDKTSKNENSTTKGQTSSGEEATTKGQTSSGEETTTKGQTSSGEETTTKGNSSSGEEATTKGNSSGSEESTTSSGNGYGGPPEYIVTKPTSITVMWDNSIVAEDNGGREFVKALSRELGITVNMVRPEHSAYYDVLQTSFVSDSVPDVFILSANHYAQYASMGALYDMTSMWNSSEMKCKFDSWAVDYVESYVTKGKKVGQYGLYGFPIMRGNGCVTYVRTAWLEACGYKADGSNIKTYNDYWNMLVAFKKKYNVAPVTAPGYLYTEAPYTHFLPEFYQTAYPDFYKNSSGVWVDGFSEQAMKDALERLQQANQAGLLDPDMGTNMNSDARNGFYAEEHGVFSYWAGTWAQTITDKLVAVGVEDTRITALKPIRELGKYVERKTAVAVIYSKANNPEGIFKYFIEPIYDGSKVQSLWTYGVENVHWSTKRETITLKNKDYTYYSGEFHFLPDPATYSSFMKKNCIDPLLALDDFNMGCDPATTAKSPLIPEKAYEVMNMFNVNSKVAPVLASNSVIGNNAAKIWEARYRTITEIVANGKDVDMAMTEYKVSVSSEVRACLESLNK